MQDTVLGNRHHPLTAMSAAVQCRAGLRGSMSGNRSLMYLDLSLEDVIRGCAERSASSVDNLETGSQLFAMLLENLCLSVRASASLTRPNVNPPSGGCLREHHLVGSGPVSHAPCCM